MTKCDKWIGMIDEYLTEPHSIDKDWIELLSAMRKILTFIKEWSSN